MNNYLFYGSIDSTAGDLEYDHGLWAPTLQQSPQYSLNYESPQIGLYPLQHSTRPDDRGPDRDRMTYTLLGFDVETKVHGVHHHRPEGQWKCGQYLKACCDAGQARKSFYSCAIANDIAHSCVYLICSQSKWKSLRRDLRCCFVFVFPRCV